MALTPKTLRSYHVFIASPSDMHMERRKVHEFFEEFNRTTAHTWACHFQILDWEHDATARAGDPEKGIISEVLEKFEGSLALVIGLLGQRFGSPTSTHESGTEQEFEWALDRRRSTSWPEIKWFFRQSGNLTEVPSEPEKAKRAVAQLERVQEFRRRVSIDPSAQLLYREFRHGEFADVLRKDLFLWLNDRSRPWHSPHAQPPTPDASSTAPAGLPDGVVRASTLRSSTQRLPNENFAVELLIRPLTIERLDQGGLRFTVDRRDVSEMLISNTGKRAKVDEYVTAAKRDTLQVFDESIHRFMIGKGSGQMAISPNELGIRLRWASGGILSVISFAGSDKLWVPFFFRDIRPYGWNIALGASERWFLPDGSVNPNYPLDVDLNEPTSVVTREFLEESLVIDQQPRRNSTVRTRRFSIPHALGGIPAVRAADFGEEHRRKRRDEDGLEIEGDGSPIEAQLVRTNCTLAVRTQSPRASETRDVLIAVSLLDLGIEVVKVLRYELQPDNYLLDGEILVIHDSRGSMSQELIRMPIALMSCDYLREVFSDISSWFRYTSGLQPSFEVARAPRLTSGDRLNDEILLFDWDVQRRMDAINGLWGGRWQRDRFEGWHDAFGDNFFDSQGLPSAHNASRLFTPATAKILSLYFNLIDSDRKR